MNEYIFFSDSPVKDQRWPLVTERLAVMQLGATKTRTGQCLEMEKGIVVIGEQNFSHKQKVKPW